MTDVSKESIKYFKSILGKTVFAMPTGNYARRGVDKQELKEITITKVGRVNVTFQFTEGWQREETYRVTDFKPNRLSSDYNSGYIIYESKEVYENECKRNELISYMSDFFHGKGWGGKKSEKLSLEQLEKIKKIIDEVENNG